MRSIIFLVCLASLLAGCSSSVSVGEDDKLNRPGTYGRALLELEYTNHAWGYGHSGLVIDDRGTVIRYAQPHGDTVWVPSPTESYSDSDLAAKFTKGRTVVGTIGADTVATIRSLLGHVAHGKQSELQSVGADMGSQESWGYFYDSSTQLSTRYSLQLMGDHQRHNMSPEAIKLASMLDAINTRYP